MNTRTELANRHIAKLLDNLDKLVDMSPLAKTAVMQELHWLAEDVEENTKQVITENSKENTNHEQQHD